MPTRHQYAETRVKALTSINTYLQQSRNCYLPRPVANSYREKYGVLEPILRYGQSTFRGSATEIFQFPGSGVIAEYLFTVTHPVVWLHYPARNYLPGDVNSHLRERSHPSYEDCTIHVSLFDFYCLTGNTAITTIMYNLEFFPPPIQVRGCIISQPDRKEFLERADPDLIRQLCTYHC